MTDQLNWRDGAVPVSTRFDDPYFSLDNGLAETRHVFLQGNGLPKRFHDGFHIAELGFGTGLNLLTAWQAFEGPGRLYFSSFEAFPITREEAEQALAAFPELAARAAPLLSAWSQDSFVFEADGLRAEVIMGDANETVADWDGNSDAWFLDGFSPAKNPELWNDTLLARVGAHTRTGGTFATYTAAGHVRRALDAAGFEVTRVPGFGRKRHMSVGVKR
ncbi:MAG: tRNA (5-methylaminomethyl-2-thiouridine)(34)-methyltransferase MnmD [Litoreibacter sp.]|nr:tRNA (5-methylaminomethyl-2-thiouridine)(34)-methyltransferase MnmD [Litoreibacter sp.]MCY4334838.1 tRNA (5-methylaminomethyl-2-thiouridine)(34)-methyltransferase MnmD [Litoreibacter sp.]